MLWGTSCGKVPLNGTLMYDEQEQFVKHTALFVLNT